MALGTFYSNASDGVITNENATWSTCRNATDGLTVSNSSASEYVVADNGGISNAYRVWRLFLPFDTSALPDDATITDAVLSVCDASSSQGTDAHALVQTSQASGTALSTADFDAIGTTEGATRVTAFTAGAYHDWTLNATGLTWISKTGFTLLGLRAVNDIDNVTPTANTYRAWRMSETADTTSDPKLVITYSLGGGSVSYRNLLGVGI
jgi:hypothetical protein